MLGHEGEGQIEGEVEIRGEKLLLALIGIEQQQYATGLQQAEIVRFVQQPGSVKILLLVLLTDDGVEGVLLHQGQQATALVVWMAVVVDPVGGHPLFGQFPGDGATEQGILFEQQYRHAGTSCEQTIRLIMVDPRGT